MRWGLGQVSRLGSFLFIAVLAVWGFGFSTPPEEPGTLVLRVTEEGRPTSVRVEVTDAEGRCFTAEDALLVGGD